LTYNLTLLTYKYASKKVDYWRSKTGTEIDFVVVRGQKIIPLEVKYKDLNKPVVIEKYTPNALLWSTKPLTRFTSIKKRNPG